MELPPKTEDGTEPVVVQANKEKKVTRTSQAREPQGQSHLHLQSSPRAFSLLRTVGFRLPSGIQSRLGCSRTHPRSPARVWRVCPARSLAISSRWMAHLAGGAAGQTLELTEQAQAHQPSPSLPPSGTHSLEPTFPGLPTT